MFSLTSYFTSEGNSIRSLDKLAPPSVLIYYLDSVQFGSFFWPVGAFKSIPRSHRWFVISRVVYLQVTNLNIVAAMLSLLVL